MKVDIVLLFTFTKEFSLQTFDSFLKKIHRSISFSTLVLGKGASFGKDRKGTQKQVEALGEKEEFSVKYLLKQSGRRMLFLVEKLEN